jgi:hypothetical protein
VKGSFGGLSPPKLPSPARYSFQHEYRGHYIFHPEDLLNIDELTFIRAILETGTAKCYPQGRPKLGTDDGEQIIRWYEAGHEIVMEKTCPAGHEPNRVLN